MLQAALSDGNLKQGKGKGRQNFAAEAYVEREGKKHKDGLPGKSSSMTTLSRQSSSSTPHEERKCLARAKHAIETESLLKRRPLAHVLEVDSTGM